MPAICSRVSLIQLALAAAVALPALAGIVPSQPAAAQVEAGEIEVFSVTQEDRDQDGDVDVAIIDSSYITDRDRVTVFDRGNDMVAADTWQEATDFSNDIWVFDAASDGLVELIIDFRPRSNGAAEAWLWDDQDGDGTVQFDTTSRAVRESNNPTVKVVANDGWWVKDGKINFNLEISVDGRVQASFSSKHWLQYVTTDGVVDHTVQVRDTDRDGRPDYQWVSAWPQAPSSYGIRRTEIVVSTKDDEAPITGSIFWPYLGSTRDWDEQMTDRTARIPESALDIVQSTSGYNKSYNLSGPPIQMLWHKGAILYVSEFVASRFNDDNWFVYSIRRVTSSRTSEVNFEAPFAFYDLAADDDGYPELAIRFEQYLQRDPFAFKKTNAEPVQIIRQSWDQDNSGTWDYKLGLIGRHEIDKTTTVGNLTLKMIPPEDLRGWITDHAWDGATFVADEGNEKWTSEGLYEWDPVGYWRDEYVTGLASEPPVIDQLSPLAEGQRGEYAFDLHGEARLYLSPVDQRLHLLGAEGGIWNIDETRQIYVENLGGDYINKWSLVENGVTTDSLYFVPEAGYAFYDGPDGVQVVATDQPAALFTTAPPTTNEEREALSEQLPDSAATIVPDDLKARALALGGSAIQLNGASIEDFRLVDGGFRFALTVESAISATVLEPLGIGALEPGKYIVEYHNQFRVSEFAPPVLAVTLEVPSAETVELSQPVPLLAAATNRGASDAHGLTLVIEARNGNQTIEVTRRQIDVLSNEPTRVALSWGPPSSGEWKLQARLEGPNEDVLATGSWKPVAVESEAPSFRRILLVSAGGIGYVIPLAASILAFAMATVGVTWLVLTGGASPRPDGDGRPRRRGPFGWPTRLRERIRGRGARRQPVPSSASGQGRSR